LRKDLIDLAEENAKYTDINDDGLVNLKDLVMVKKLAAGIAE
jgi:hypothetical protein